MEVQQLRHGPLEIAHLSLPPSQVWCLWGGNGAGKSLLCQLLAGHCAPAHGTFIDRPGKVSLVSLERQQALYEEELRRNDSDFLDEVDQGRTVWDLLNEGEPAPKQVEYCVQTLSLGPLLARPYRQLSSGEARRVLIALALRDAPDLLILDQPFEGLDREAVPHMHGLCQQLVQQGQGLLLAINRHADLGNYVTHLALLHRGQLVAQGPRDAILAQPEALSLLEYANRPAPEAPAPPPRPRPASAELVVMRNLAVRYGETYQFKGLNWTLQAGAHTRVVGPNGCGKSTLLQLITGDHPQCYSNDLRVFGYQRGQGESIWDIKQHIGLVSAALHRDYRVSGDVLATVVSGLYDSIGIYRSVSLDDRRHGMAWLERLGLADKAQHPFRQLPYGHQRLVLIARALVKQPPLLVLDEPTQGLDDLNRQLVLAFMEQLARLRHTTLLFVSHREDEHLPLFQHTLRFEPAPEATVRFQICQTAHSSSAVSSADA